MSLCFVVDYFTCEGIQKLQTVVNKKDGGGTRIDSYILINGVTFRINSLIKSVIRFQEFSQWLDL